jgi:hypothetical protein
MLTFDRLRQLAKFLWDKMRADQIVFVASSPLVSSVLVRKRIPRPLE